MRRSRFGLSTIVIFVLAVVGLSVPADAAPGEAGAPAASAARSATDSPEARALAQAKTTGRPVEVTSARTETETVIAEPAGHLTSRIYAAPDAGPTAVRPLRPISSWALVDKQHPDRSYFNWRMPGGADVGYYGATADGPYVKRLFFMFDTSALRGAKIMSAYLSFHESGAATCAASPLNAYLSEDISATSRPTWNRQPGLASPVLSRWTKKYGKGCNQAEGRIGFDVTAGVAKRADEGRSHATFALRAADEKTNNGLRRLIGPAEADFRLHPYLSVKYNQPPDAPKASQMWAPWSENRCARKPAAATHLNPFMPVVDDDGRVVEWRSNESARLSARASDQDGDYLDLVFVMQTATGLPLGRSREFVGYGGGIASVAITDTLGSNGSSESNAAPGLKPHLRLPWGVRNGSVLRWRARAFDQDSAGAFSPWCYIKVDYRRPATPVITSPDFEDDVPGEWQPTVTFTFTSGGASTFEYVFKGIGVKECPSATPPTCSVQGGLATVTLPTPTSFSNTLSVVAFDKAGNRSKRTQFRLRTDG